MDGIMARQESLELNTDVSVAVVGCGGVGSWTAYFLALAGVRELYLFDNDEVSDHNLNRLPLTLEMVGQKKSKALADMIKRHRPECKVLALGHFSPEIAAAMDLRFEIDWVIATTDSAMSRRMVSDWASAHSKYYLEAAAEGEIGSATGLPAEWSTPEENMPGYQSVPVWVGPCVMSASIAVAHVLHDRGMYDRVVRVGWDKESDQFGLFDSEVEIVEEDEVNAEA